MHYDWFCAPGSHMNIALFSISLVCVHPDSPAPGQRWMDGPVSFYKVKLSHSSEDPDAAVVLRPMHRYQPRLCVVPVSTGPEPDVHVFTFPKNSLLCGEQLPEPADDPAQDRLQPLHAGVQRGRAERSAQAGSDRSLAAACWPSGTRPVQLSLCGWRQNNVIRPKHKESPFWVKHVLSTFILMRFKY